MASSPLLRIHRKLLRGGIFYVFKWRTRRFWKTSVSVTGTGIRCIGGFALLWTSVVQANPVGEQVVAGAAGFERAGGALTVTQGTDRAVINWSSFSIGAGEITKFVQPNSSSAVLNRVITANNPSAIYGTLQANGQVYLINPAGIFIGPGGLVDTAGFVASTHDVDTKEFMSGGDLNFTGGSGASIINQGRIEAKQGDVFLVARQVSNEGQIMASDGTVGLVSGTEVCLHAIGPNSYKVRLINVANDAGVKKTGNGIADVVNAGVIEAANAELESTGNYLSLAIKNTGVIRATGVVPNADGTVTLTGGEGDILNTGVVAAIRKNIQGETAGGMILASAKNITTDPGSIITAAGTENGGEIRLAAKDTVYASGKVEAGSAAGKGGKVQVTGERVALIQAEVDVSGKTGGGTVLVGGDYMGKNPEVPNAKAVVMTSHSVIRANATENGDGGKVILWSDEYTGFYGEIFARGGIEGGNGGFVETSSYDNLQAWGAVDVSSVNGKSGTWLMDPFNLYITTTDSNVTVTTGVTVSFAANNVNAQANANSILAALNNNTSVIVETTSTSGQETGDIIVARPIVANDGSTGSLTLRTTAVAAGDLAGGIQVLENANISVGGGLTLTAALATLGGEGGSISVLADLSSGGAMNLTAGAASGVDSIGGSISVLADLYSGGSMNLVAGNGLNTGGTGGDVTISANITAVGGLSVSGGSTNSASGNAGSVTIAGQITLGTGTSSVLQAGNGISGGVAIGTGGNLVVSAPITGASAILTLNAGNGKTGGVLTLNSGSTIGTSLSQFASVSLQGDNTLSVGSEIYSTQITVAPNLDTTAIWLNETPIQDISVFNMDSSSINNLISDNLTIGKAALTGDFAIGQAGSVSFRASNVTFRAAKASATDRSDISFNAPSGSAYTISLPSGGTLTIDTGGTLYSNFSTASTDIYIPQGTVNFQSTRSASGSTASIGNATDPILLNVAKISGASIGGNAFIQTADAVAFSGAFNAGNNNLNLVAGGDITQTAGAIITAQGASNVFNASGNNVTLNLANDFGTVQFSSVNNAAITDSSGIVFAASTLTGGLTVNAGVDITQSGVLTVPGNTSVTSTSGVINLSSTGPTNWDNDFQGAVTLTGSGTGAISIRDKDNLILGGLTQAGAGNVTISVGSTQGTGTASLIQTGVITTGTAIAGGGVFTINASTTGATTSINLSTQDNLIRSANITIGTPLQVSNYQFRNTASVADPDGGLAGFSGSTKLENVALYYGTLAGVGTAPLTSLGGVKINNSGGLTLFATAIQQAAGAGIFDVSGATSVTATAGDILLSQSNKFTGAVTLTASGDGNISVLDVNTLLLGQVTMGSAGIGILDIETAAGDITQSSGTTISSGKGNVRVTAGSGGVIALANQNDFRGTVALTGGATSITDVNALTLGTLTTGALTAISTGALNLGSGNVSGALSATSNGGNITQTGALSVGGATFNAGTGAVVLTASGNRYGSTVTVNSSASADLFINLLDESNLGAVNASGAFTLTTDNGTSFNIANGSSIGFDVDNVQLTKLNVGTFAPTASGTGNINMGTFNFSGIKNLSLTTSGTGGIAATGAITLQTLSMNSGGTATFAVPNYIQNLSQTRVNIGGLSLKNAQGMNLTGTVALANGGSANLEVAGQLLNNTGSSTPFSGTTGSTTIRMLSPFVGGSLSPVAGFSGFTPGYNGQNPGAQNSVIYAVSPLTMFAPSGTVIAGVDLSGTQTGGGQLNTFFTGSDDLNWMISDFEKFSLPKVSSAGLEYTIYPKRVEPETRSLPDSTLSQLRQELGRPPTIEEINKREVSMRQSDRLRAGSILERSSLDIVEESNDPQENAKTSTPLPTEGQIPQANQVPKKAISPDNKSPEALPPVASRGSLPSGSVQVDGKGAETVRELLMKERASAEVGLSIPVANSQ